MGSYALILNEKMENKNMFILIDSLSSSLNPLFFHSHFMVCLCAVISVVCSSCLCCLFWIFIYLLLKRRKSEGTEGTEETVVPVHVAEESDAEEEDLDEDTMVEVLEKQEVCRWIFNSFIISWSE